MTFSWPAITGATGYLISTNGGSSFVAPSGGATGLTHTVSGLPGNTTVSILVKAIGVTACETSLNAGPVSGTTLSTREIFVPNAFTPNDDSYNDFFSVFMGEAVTINQCRLYNRWGQLVYDSPDAEWDGLDLKKRICAMGVYVYRITYSIEGDATEYIKEGNVTLIR